MSDSFMPSRFFMELKEREGIKPKTRILCSRIVSSEGVCVGYYSFTRLSEIA